MAPLGYEVSATFASVMYVGGTQPPSVAFCKDMAPRMEDVGANSSKSVRMYAAGTPGDALTFLTSAMKT